MVHRRIQQDDSRGVQEPLNETMCGCNDIGADPGKMGAHGHEGDGGCECAGLTMRGRHWLIFGPIQEVHKSRRVLSETINFPATLAFHKPSTQNVLDRTSYSAVSAALPANVKLVTLTSNYAESNDGAFLLRLSHLYEAGEHDTLAQPVNVNLQEVFGQAGLKIASAIETTLSGNQPLAVVEARKHRWKTRTANQAVADQMAQCKSFDERVPFTFPEVTIRPMEVRTFMAKFD
jgi:alpha-mannosidase